MGAIKNILETRLPGVHVHSLMIGASPNEDTLNGFFMSVPHQIEIACDRIKNDPLLQTGYVLAITSIYVLYLLTSNTKGTNLRKHFFLHTSKY